MADDAVPHPPEVVGLTYEQLAAHVEWLYQQAIDHEELASRAARVDFRRRQWEHEGHRQAYVAAIGRLTGATRFEVAAKIRYGTWRAKNAS